MVYMAIAKDDLRTCLINKFGFTPVPGTNHRAVALFINGRKVATTRFSGSHVTLSDDILLMIGREIWVQMGELKKMYGCTIGSEDYRARLRDRKHIQ
jgi:hypothetical protein